MKQPGIFVKSVLLLWMLALPLLFVLVAAPETILGKLSETLPFITSVHKFALSLFFSKASL